MLAIVMTFVLASTISAGNVKNGDFTLGPVTVDGVDANTASVIAGETVTIKVYFNAKSDVYASDIKVKAEIEGDKDDVSVTSETFDVEDNKSYRKVLTLTIPSELNDKLSDDATLTVKISGGDSETTEEEFTLRVQRPSYDAEVKSITADNSVEAGQSLPVEIVLKNVGYNELEDVYVTAKITALGVSKSAYLGDLVSLEECDCKDDTVCNKTCGSCMDDDDTDTMSKTLYLSVPYDAKAGIYTLEVEVTNDDTKTTEVMQVEISNDFSSNVVVSSAKKTVAAGENAEYSLILVNPTNKLKVYRIVTESAGEVSSSADSAVVAVPAGSSKTVTVTASAEDKGEYSFNVNVFSGETLESTVALQLSATGSSSTSPMVILTVILAVVFLVLLVVLIVLLGKKPEKAEEFGESYY